jgi:hypothetical protein
MDRYVVFSKWDKHIPYGAKDLLQNSNDNSLSIPTESIPNQKNNLFQNTEIHMHLVTPVKLSEKPSY